MEYFRKYEEMYFVEGKVTFQTNIFNYRKKENAKRIFDISSELKARLKNICQNNDQLQKKTFKKNYLTNDFLYLYSRILDSMKVPGQRSSFHICDILDLNTNSDAKNGIHHASNTTTFPPHTTNSISSRDDANSLSSTATTAQPYQLPSNINSAMYPELAPHYHSMFPAVTKSWLKENENYGEFGHILYFDIIQ